MARGMESAPTFSRKGTPPFDLKSNRIFSNIPGQDSSICHCEALFARSNPQIALEKIASLPAAARNSPTCHILAPNHRDDTSNQ